MKSALVWGFAVVSLGSVAGFAAVHGRHVAGYEDQAAFTWRKDGACNLELAAVCTAEKSPVRCWKMNGDPDADSTEVVASYLFLHPHLVDRNAARARLLLVREALWAPGGEPDLFWFGGPGQPISKRVGIFGAPQPFTLSQLFAFYPPDGATSIDVKAAYRTFVQPRELGPKGVIRLSPRIGASVATAFGTLKLDSAGPVAEPDVPRDARANLGDGKLFRFRIVAQGCPSGVVFDGGGDFGSQMVYGVNSKGAPRFSSASDSSNSSSIGSWYPQSQLLQVTEMGQGGRAFDFISNIDPAYYAQITLWPSRTTPIRFPAIPLEPNQP